LFCLHRMGWIKTRPAQRLLARVKFTGNSYSYRTCVNVNGHHGNTRIPVFTGTHMQVPGLVLVSMWMHPKALSDEFWCWFTAVTLLSLYWSWWNCTGWSWMQLWYSMSPCGTGIASRLRRLHMVCCPHLVTLTVLDDSHVMSCCFLDDVVHSVRCQETIG